uniref:Carbohydrate kinase PfkB domain-containing protein n=1 Tax=Xenopus tropicalis TaxID=8364 RepID=A0A6I8SNK2_XENTR
MIAAHRAGIPVFVTGGVGGVHHEGEKTMDVSADLTELGRTPVAVISAGVKSILDIGRTLEYLETEGVCVSTFGDSTDFPAFFTPKSGFKAPCRGGTRSLELGLSSGILLAVPIPAEHAAPGNAIEEAVQQALREARLQGVQGKEVTPFLLQRVNELTGGQSLESNIALIKNNARVGSRIAVALSQLRNPKGGQRKKPGQLTPLMGCSILLPPLQFGGQTNPGQVHQSFGGVGRNLADCLCRLGAKPLFISALGQDEHANSVMHYCSHMDMGGVARLKGHNTATYCAVISGTGELSLGLGDMDIHQQITENYVSQFADCLAQARLVCIDGNIPLSTIQYVCGLSRRHGVPVCFEPTDEDKSCKPFLSDSWTALSFISPNLKELIGINRALGYPVPQGEIWGAVLPDIIPIYSLVCAQSIPSLYICIYTYG